MKIISASHPYTGIEHGDGDALARDPPSLNQIRADQHRIVGSIFIGVPIHRDPICQHYRYRAARRGWGRARSPSPNRAIFENMHVRERAQLVRLRIAQIRRHAVDDWQFLTNLASRPHDILSSQCR